MSTRRLPPVRSRIAWSDAQSIHVHGFDLCQELLGKLDLGSMAFLQLVHRMPTPQESVVFNALLVSLVEHGITPSTLSARLTLLGAPEALQGAVAAGLLGLGTTFVGTIEGAARIVQENPLTSRIPEEVDGLADSIVVKFVEQRQPIPGVGHPIHKPVDPRAERLFDLAREHRIDDSGEVLIRAVSRAAERRLQRSLPVNVTGAVGAIATTLGVPWGVTRGLGLMARTVGLVGHLLEELEQPIARSIWYQAEEQAHAEVHSKPKGDR
jgi:citrate synthase